MCRGSRPPHLGCHKPIAEAGAGLDGTPAGWQALAAATSLITRDDARLIVVLLGSEDDVKHMDDEVEAWLAERRLTASRVILPRGPGEIRRLASLLLQERSGLIVVPRPSLRRERQAFRTLLSGVSCPLLVVG